MATAKADKPKIYAPIAGGTTSISSPFGEQNHGSPPHTHMGIDVPVPVGTACVAPCDGKIGHFANTSGFGGEGGMIHFVFTHDVGDIKQGTVIGWGHVGRLASGIAPGVSVKGGQTIAYSNHSAPHVHFIMRYDDAAEDGNTDPTSIFKALQSGDTTPTKGGKDTSTGGSGTSTSAGDAESIAKAAAFSTYLELPGLFTRQEALALSGKRSLMNDVPLLPFVEQLAQASLRNFQSMPNGNFYAFFPDYFGGLSHRTAYWAIEDVEIIDGSIDLSDDALATHVFVVGDVALFDGQITFDDRIQTSGIVTIFDAFQADFLNGLPDDLKTKVKVKNSPRDNAKYDTPHGTSEFQPPQDRPTIDTKDAAIAFLQKYGARPHYEEATMIRSPYFELFLAYQKFMLMWSRQFLTTFTFTFMPELYPGGLVAFPDHGIQCYVEEVIHNCDYEQGFTTTANLSAPSALPSSDRKNINEGMIRAFSLGGDLPGQLTPKPKSKGKPKGKK